MQKVACERQAAASQTYLVILKEGRQPGQALATAATHTQQQRITEWLSDDPGDITPPEQTPSVAGCQWMGISS